MNRPMRRKDREISRGEAMDFLAKGEYGVLSTADGDGLPYGVPLSYIVKGDILYFHCAREGRKLDNLRVRPQVSFCTVGNVKPYFSGDFSTTYESVIASGTVREVTEEQEKRALLVEMCAKYMPEHAAAALDAAQRAHGLTSVWALEIEQVSGKRNG